MSGAKVTAYKVVLDVPGCKHCHAGKMWSVRSPDGYLLGTSWTSRDDAIEVAALMNRAYAEGRSAAESLKGRR